MAEITIVDYGVGNLLSVRRAFEFFEATVTFADTPAEIAKADRLVLPGVGAFADAMNELRKRELVEPIREYCSTNRPFLGICLGMQLMLEESEEFGRHEGMGLIPGKVTAIPLAGLDGESHKVPHIGWNGLLSTGSTWEKTILAGLQEHTPVYFVHSFTPQPYEPAHRLADCDYDGIRLSAVIQKGNLYGCQFHPEKSGVMGLKIIKNFVKL